MRLGNSTEARAPRRVPNASREEIGLKAELLASILLCHLVSFPVLANHLSTPHLFIHLSAHLPVCLSLYMGCILMVETQRRCRLFT